MLTTTKATISINGAILNSSREDFLIADGVEKEALYARSQENIRLYGTDLLMFAEGDLFINERQFFSSGDLREVSGLLNYAQAITHRLVTDRGTHPEDRFFGVPWRNYLGQSYASKSVITSRLVADITEELYKDRRTKEVAEVRAVFSTPTSVEVTCSVIPITAQREVISISLAVEDRQ